MANRILSVEGQPVVGGATSRSGGGELGWHDIYAPGAPIVRVIADLGEYPGLGLSWVFHGFLEDRPHPTAVLTKFRRITLSPEDYVERWGQEYTPRVNGPGNVPPIGTPLGPGAAVLLTRIIEMDFDYNVISDIESEVGIWPDRWVHERPPNFSPTWRRGPYVHQSSWDIAVNLRNGDFLFTVGIDQNFSFSSEWYATFTGSNQQFRILYKANVNTISSVPPIVYGIGPNEFGWPLGLRLRVDDTVTVRISQDDWETLSPISVPNNLTGPGVASLGTGSPGTGSLAWPFNGAVELGLPSEIRSGTPASPLPTHNFTPYPGGEMGVYPDGYVSFYLGPTGNTIRAANYEFSDSFGTIVGTPALGVDVAAGSEIFHSVATQDVIMPWPLGEESVASVERQGVHYPLTIGGAIFNLDSKLSLKPMRRYPWFIADPTDPDPLVLEGELTTIRNLAFTNEGASFGVDFYPYRNKAMKLTHLGVRCNARRGGFLDWRIYWLVFSMRLIGDSYELELAAVTAYDGSTVSGARVRAPTWVGDTIEDVFSIQFMRPDGEDLWTGGGPRVWRTDEEVDERSEFGYSESFIHGGAGGGGLTAVEGSGSVEPATLSRVHKIIK